MATAKQIMDIAAGFVGVTERPANSNNVIFNTDYYGHEVSGENYPWCCVFEWDCFMRANASGLFYDGKKTAYCPTLYEWAKAKGLEIPKNEGRYGDVVMFNWGKQKAQHTGFVESRNSDGSYICIEGNTSLTSNDNGGRVMRRKRYQSEIMQIWRPEYDKHSIDYTAHCQSYGWMKKVKDWEIAGTVGKAKRLEAITINPHGIKLKARVHIQSIGWTNWITFDQAVTLGTTGQAKRLEAIEIVSLTDGIEIEYQAHMQTFGWGSVYRNGKTSNGYAGTVGQARRIEAVRIRLV